MPRRSKRTRRTRRKRKQRGGSTIPICIYSHSEFFDILQIQFEYLTKLFKGAQQPIYLFADKKFNGQTDLKYTTILYDGAAPYMQRVATCIEQIKEPYCILSHENDILLQYDASTMNALVTAMRKHTIDSVDLRHHDTEEERIQITPTLYISRVPPQDTILFHVRPRVWHTPSALAFYKANPQKDYRSAENSNVQGFIKRQKTYELYSTDVKQRSVTGEFMCNEYVFLHVTAALKFLPDSERENGMDPLIQEAYDEIKKKYINTSSRGQLTSWAEGEGILKEMAA